VRAIDRLNALANATNSTTTHEHPVARGHLLPLDGVRGLAILMVMGTHAFESNYETTSCRVGEGMLRVLRELPLVWFLIGALFAGLCILLLRRTESSWRLVYLRRLAMGAGLLTLAIFVALNLYSIRSYMLDADEADILSIAMASLHGQPMYHAVNSPNFSYSMIYGPLTFLIYRVGLVIGDGRFWVLRAMLVVANLLLCCVLYSTFRKVVRRDTALALMALPLCQLLVQVKYAFGLRPDAWIVLAMALAVRSTLIDADLTAAVLTGFFAGIAIDLKATVGLAFLLLLLMLYRRSGSKPVAIAAGVATVTALIPFALPNISLVDYWLWLTVAGHEGVSVGMVGWSLAYAIFMILPLVVFRLCGINPWPGTPGRRSLPEIALFICCLLAAVAVASKPGAGIWHFWQLMPILAAYVALAAGRSQTSNTERVAYAILIVTLGSTAVALPYVRRDISTLKAPSAAVLEQLSLGERQIGDYLNLYRGRTIQVGYGRWHSPVESLRYIPVLHGQPYTLDGSERLEVFLVRFPYRVLEKMNHCTDDVWLIPHGERPFTFYYVFPPELHDTFVRDYAIEQRGAAFDAWVCKAR